MESVSLSLENPAAQRKQSLRLLQVPRSDTFVEFQSAEIEQSISDRFEEQVEHYPDRIAIKTKDCTLTYHRLNQLANRVAHALLDRNPLREEPVAFLLDRRVPQIIAILGILKAGKIYVPLDTTFPTPRLASILEDAQASLIVTDTPSRALAEELTQGTRALLSLDTLDPHLPLTNPGLTISPDTIVNIFHTSGSTGRPKGVICSHRVILHTVMNSTNNYGIDRGDHVALFFSASFAASIFPLFGALLNGATLFPYDLKHEGFAQLGDWLAREQITFFMAVPSTFRRLVASFPDTANLPHLRRIGLGGEPVYKRDVDLYKQYFADACVLCVHYAGTEARTICSYFIDKETRIETNIVPVGYPAADKKIFLLDAEGKEVAAHEVGEITVKSRYLATGYWRQAQLTREAFQPDPQGSQARIYRTGDLGRMRPDGCLEYLGRKDSQVKIRGHRVETGEVEMVLLDLDGVKEAAVSAKEDQTGRKYLAAYLVSDETTFPPIDVLRAALSNVLPDYMIPSRFVLVAALPLTVTGKVDYQALPEPLDTRPDLQTAFVAPRTAQETILQQIWQGILDIRPIGVHDNFFDLGGDSLAVEEVLTQIEQRLYVTLPPDVFIQGATIDSLATLLRQPETAIVKSSLVAIQPAGAHPPFFCASGYDGTALPLRRLGPLLAPDQPFYGLRDPRLEHKAVPFVSVEDTAAHYIQVLRTHQPQGPYYLGGYSFGCVIAFEIAQQLHQAGQQVRALMFLDLPRGCYPRRLGVSTGARIGFLVKQNGLANSCKEIARSWWLSFKQLTPSLFGPLSIREANILAQEAYIPQRYPGRIIFFQTRDNQGVPDLWKNLIAGSIEIHHIPGDHHTMLRDPDLQILIEKFKTILLRLQREA